MTTSDKQSLAEQAVAPRKNSKVRELLTMGVFIALYLVLFFIGGALSFFPLLVILLPAFYALFGAVIFVLLLGKVQRPGVFLITSILIGLILFRDAPGGITTYLTIAGGLVAEVLYSLLGRRSFRSMSISYAVFILGYALGTYIPLVWMREAYIDLYTGRNPAMLETVRESTELINASLMIGLCALTVIVSFIGCFWGRAMTRRQFARAGIV